MIAYIRKNRKTACNAMAAYAAIMTIVLAPNVLLARGVGGGGGHASSGGHVASVSEGHSAPSHASSGESEGHAGVTSRHDPEAGSMFGGTAEEEHAMTNPAPIWLYVNHGYNSDTKCDKEHMENCQ